MRPPHVLSAALSAFVLVAMPAIVHAGPVEDAIEAREGYMKMMSINMATLAGMAKGDIAYDEAAATLAATNIVALTQYDAAPLFVEGSSSAEMDTEALPAIWENPDDFRAKFVAFAEAASGAPEAVAGGQANIGPALQKMGGACKACHDDYRKP